MAEDKFYVGQRVEIVGNSCGHHYDLGEVVLLIEAHQVVDDYWSLYGEKWSFDSDDCKPL